MTKVNYSETEIVVGDSDYSGSCVYGDDFEAPNLAMQVAQSCGRMRSTHRSTTRPVVEVRFVTLTRIDESIDADYELRISIYGESNDDAEYFQAWKREPNNDTLYEAWLRQIGVDPNVVAALYASWRKGVSAGRETKMHEIRSVLGIER